MSLPSITRANRCKGFHADQVVFAAPQFLTRYLLRPYREQPPPHVAAFEYGTWMVANLTLKDRPQSAAFRSPGTMCFTKVRRSATSSPRISRDAIAARLCSPITIRYVTQTRARPEARLLGMDWQSCADVALTDLTRCASGHSHTGRAPGRDALGTRDDPAAAAFRLGSGPRRRGASRIAGCILPTPT